MEGKHKSKSSESPDELHDIMPKSKDPGSHSEIAPKKRRKVNHACVYCRRSHMTCDLERPCTRCIKRNIGHLCHDEPRDTDSKKAKSVAATSSMDEPDIQPEPVRSTLQNVSVMGPPPSFDGNNTRQTTTSFSPAVLSQGNPLQLVQQQTLSRIHPSALNNGNMNQFTGFSDAWLMAQNQFHDLQNYNPNFMIAPEVTDEFTLLDNFLHTSLLDDGGQVSDASQNSPVIGRPTNPADMTTTGFASSNSAPRHQRRQSLQTRARALSTAENTAMNTAANSAVNVPDDDMAIDTTENGRDKDKVKDKAREYYLQAADPSGNDTPEERMQRVLKAKYDAGLLKPFNYVKGYARLSKYLDSHIAPSSKHKILRCLDRFRPRFREIAQTLTDMELLYVEMWFEQQLTSYDRVFASMAIPSCLWRRTGEIYRGNKEMAELIRVPVERLRDGKIALHEILTEESLVRYWEEFGTIAFDTEHESLLTASAVQNPDDKSNALVVNCAFSFMIHKDNHKMPTIIVGNFLPHDPTPHNED